MPSLLAGLSLGAKRAPALRQSISVRGCSFAVSATFLVTAALAEAVEQEDEGQEAPNRRQRVGASQREREARIFEAARPAALAGTVGWANVLHAVAGAAGVLLAKGGKG